MRKNSFNALLIAVAVLALAASAFGQGRGRGGGAGGGRGSATGQPTGVGVDRGLGRSSDASSGRADEGRGNASNRSDGRSDAGLERARLQSENMNNANRELRRHPNIASDLRVNANDLRADYQLALAANPDLKFGQFVAATRLARNLGDRHPNVTRAAILAGLASGKSIGRTLQDLGLTSQEAKDATKQAEREVKQSTR